MNIFLKREILTGMFVGDRVTLTRTNFAPGGSMATICIKRRYFTIIQAFSLTVNKTQANIQTLRDFIL